MAILPTFSLASMFLMTAFAWSAAAAAIRPLQDPEVPGSPAERQQTRPGAAPVSFRLSPPAPPLFQFRDADIKFDLRRLMNILRDRDHEGWVLAAYPDPNTGRPLIGAGFSLDVSATSHPQFDPLNASPFFEPSSAELWKAAGLETSRLDDILGQFHRDIEAWPAKEFKRKVRKRLLPSQLTEEEATHLLHISAIQAVSNAKGYCRNFDRLSASQQMALTQLVFQMGVNLEEFVHFLSALNGDADSRDLSQPNNGSRGEASHWRSVQAALIDSQWARLYPVRAVKVIAMFDPGYAGSPHVAERKIEAILRPPVKRRGGRTHAAKGPKRSVPRPAGTTRRKRTSRSR